MSALGCPVSAIGQRTRACSQFKPVIGLLSPAAGGGLLGFVRPLAGPPVGGHGLGGAGELTATAGNAVNSLRTWLING